MVGIALVAPNIVRVGDKIRLDASQTTVLSPSVSVTVQSVTIQPESTAASFNVTGSPVNQKRWFLDYFYASSGQKTVTVTVTLSDATVYSKTFTVQAISAADDKLLVDDEDIRSYDFEILRFIPEGFSTWRHVHRKATQDVVFFVNSLRIKNLNNPITLDELLPSPNARQLALMLSLHMIYSQLSNRSDDKFYQRAMEAKKAAESIKSLPDFIIDFNKDSVLEPSEAADILSGRLSRQ